MSYVVFYFNMVIGTVCITRKSRCRKDDRTMRPI